MGRVVINIWRGFAFDNPAQVAFLKSPARYRLLSSGYGGGKLLALDTPIFTPGGWSSMGELAVGQQVYDERGKPCTVTAVFDEWPERAWRLRFSDGTHIIAGGEHQWVTWDHNARKALNRSARAARGEFPPNWPGWRSSARRNGHGPAIRTTDEIVQTIKFGPLCQNNHCIPCCGPIELPEAELPIDPYVFGVWLGDGSSNAAMITTEDPQVLDEIRAAGYSVGEPKGSGKNAYWIGAGALARNPKTGQMIATGSIQSKLRRLGVMGDKHVPDQYLYASATQRLALLQGLMDSDGYASGDRKSTVEFCSTNPELAGAVMWLARSLGQKPVCITGRATLNGKDCGTKYRVQWRPTIDVFRLERKRDRINLGGAQLLRSHHRMIVGADPVPIQPMRCITVDSPHNLYLAGSGLIPTHNSKLGCRESIRIALEYPGSRNLIARLKSTELAATTAKTFERELREIGLEKGLHYTVNKNEGTYYWRNGSETIFSHLESDEKFGSSEFSSIFVDEGSQVPDEVYEVLFPGRLRWNIGPHRAWICTNPGSSGFLRKIVYGELVGTGDEAIFAREDGRPERVVDEFAWFPVSPGANKHNPPGYNEQIARLGKAYGPHWYARYVKGDWDSFEGQRFPMFDRDKHVLKEPFRPEPHHRVIEGWDFGHRETFVAWLAYDPTGDEPVVCFAELQVQEVQEPSDVADRVKEIRARYGLERVTAMGDPAGVSSSQFSSISPITAYGALGIHIAPCKAGKSPTDRANLLAEFLSGEVRVWGGKIWPGIVFNPECEAVVRSIVNLRWDVSTNSKGEDRRERFVKKDDHGFDAVSYALVGVPPPRTRVNRPFRPEPGVNLDAADALRLMEGGLGS